MNIEIDLTSLSDEQLTAMALIDPSAVKVERERRFAFDSLEEGLTALAQAYVQLSTLLDNKRNTEGTKAVKMTGIVETCERLLATARRFGVPYELPSV